MSRWVLSGSRARCAWHCIDCTWCRGTIHPKHTGQVYRGCSQQQGLLCTALLYPQVFAKDAASGEEWFHKDGYTDLRGRFDYHTLTSAGSGSANKQLRYSLLVLVEGEGSLVLEVAAPARL